MAVERSGIGGGRRPRAASAGLRDPDAPRLGPVEELASTCEGRGAAGVATEHLGELDDAALAVELLDAGHRPAVAFALGDAEMSVGVGGDLWQVRDAQDLVSARQGPQAAPDRVGAPATDAGID